MMKKLLVFICLGLLALASIPARAQFTKGALQTIVANCFPTQTVGAITPSILVTCLNELINSYQQYASVNPQPGTTYTISATDYGTLIKFGNSGAVSVILPAPSNSGFNPFNVFATNTGVGTVTIGATGGATINGVSTFSINTNGSVWIVSDGANYQTFQASGSGTASSTANGVTCSGSPTASFASINGIVTHC